MKTNLIGRVIRCMAAFVMMGVFVAACESSGEAPFGKPCETGADCISDFCVGGETGTVRAPFCSDDCSGRKTGDTCGDGGGLCIADFVSWCWKSCETNDECVAVNPERPDCSLTSSSGMDSPFKVCTGKLQL